MSQENIEDWKVIFVNFPSRLDTGRDVIEDAIDEALEGRGEVVGGGSGTSGSNIDIEIFEGEPRDFLDVVRSVLQQLEVPNDTEIVIGDEQFPVR